MALYKRLRRRQVLRAAISYVLAAFFLRASSFPLR